MNIGWTLGSTRNQKTSPFYSDSLNYTWLLHLLRGFVSGQFPAHGQHCRDKTAQVL